MSKFQLKCNIDFLSELCRGLAQRSPVYHSSTPPPEEEEREGEGELDADGSARPPFGEISGGAADSLVISEILWVLASRRSALLRRVAPKLGLGGQVASNECRM